MNELLEEVRSARRLPPPALRKAIREAAGVSQARVAAELGVADSTVTRWERGLRKPRGEARVRYLGLLESLRSEASF